MEYLTAQQVVVILGISENTLNLWYRFKRENPENSLAQMLPEYWKANEKDRRYWKREDLDKLVKFQQAIPKGRNGIMGAVTQKYVVKGGPKNGKNTIRSKSSTGTGTKDTGRKKPKTPASNTHSGVRS